MVSSPVVSVDWGNGPRLESYLLICGRCDATTIFLDAVKSKESPNSHSYLKRESLKPEEKYTSYLLLNHHELDGFEIHKDKNDICYDEFYRDWFSKYFYVGLEQFKNLFDFEQAEKDHYESIKRLNNRIDEYRREIELLRKHQGNAKTKAAFDGFENNIKEIKEDINIIENSIKEVEEDDYDYEHYMLIKKDLEMVEQIIKEDPDIIVVAYASD